MAKTKGKAVRAYNFDIENIEWLEKEAHKEHISVSKFVNSVVQQTREKKNGKA